MAAAHRAATVDAAAADADDGTAATYETGGATWRDASEKWNHDGAAAAVRRTDPAWADLLTRRDGFKSK